MHIIEIKPNVTTSIKWYSFSCIIVDGINPPANNKPQFPVPIIEETRILERMLPTIEGPFLTLVHIIYRIGLHVHSNERYCWQEQANLIPVIDKFSKIVRWPSPWKDFKSVSDFQQTTRKMHFPLLPKYARRSILIRNRWQKDIHEGGIRPRPGTPSLIWIEQFPHDKDFKPNLVA